MVQLPLNVPGRPGRGERGSDAPQSGCRARELPLEGRAWQSSGDRAAGCDLGKGGRAGEGAVVPGGTWTDSRSPYPGGVRLRLSIASSESQAPPGSDGQLVNGQLVRLGSGKLKPGRASW